MYRMNLTSNHPVISRYGITHDRITRSTLRLATHADTSPYPSPSQATAPATGPSPHMPNCVTWYT